MPFQKAVWADMQTQQRDEASAAGVGPAEVGPDGSASLRADSLLRRVPPHPFVLEPRSILFVTVVTRTFDTGFVILISILWKEESIWVVNAAALAPRSFILSSVLISVYSLVLHSLFHVHIHAFIHHLFTHSSIHYLCIQSAAI